MRDALILLLYCFLCYPRLLAQQPPASPEGIVAASGTHSGTTPAARR